MAHSSEAELDALLQTLRTFRHLTLGRQIAVFTDSWASVKMRNWKSQSTLMLRRIEKVLRDYPLMRFQSGSENQLADLPSCQRFLMHDNNDNRCEMESEIEDGQCEAASLHESSVYDVEESNEPASSSEVCAYPVTHRQELDEQAREWIRDIHARGHYSASNLNYLSPGQTPWDGPAAWKFAEHVSKICEACQM